MNDMIGQYLLLQIQTSKSHDGKVAAIEIVNSYSTVAIGDDL